MDNHSGSNGDRRHTDKLVAWLRVEALILLAAFPLVGMILEGCTDWHLTAEWVTIYVAGIVAITGLAFGLHHAKRNGQS